MKRFSFVVLLLLITSGFALSQTRNAKLEAQLIQIDKEWTAAELRGDAKAVSMFVADDFWATTPVGTMQNKAQYMADVKASKDTDAADEFTVRIFGNTALMTHRGTVNGERSYQYRSTHVWMNRGGKWQIVAHHSSEIPATNKVVTTAPPSMDDAPKMEPAPTPRQDGARPRP